MNMPTLLRGNISFKLRFNTSHGDTNLYWRVIIDDNEYLVRSVHCNVPTFSESSFDNKAGMVKFHMAGRCSEMTIDENLNAMFAGAI